MESYLTVAKSASAEITVNKSRFIAFTACIQSREEAESVILSQKALYPDARHHCWAYILSQSGTGSRFSDDGEPSGTAGMPILGVMQKQALSHCITVVTRYFGGILLGAGGLVRAYTAAATGSISGAGRARMESCECFDCTVAYPLYEKLRRALALDGRVISRPPIFGNGVTLPLTVRICHADAVRSAITDLCSGSALFSEPEIRCCLWPDSESGAAP